jgi:hypothetical protein
MNLNVLDAKQRDQESNVEEWQQLRARDQSQGTLEEEGLHFQADLRVKVLKVKRKSEKP